MVKRVLKYVVYGIAWGWCWLVVICLIADLARLEPWSEAIFSHFPQNVLASTITGMGFGTSSIVYTFTRLRLWQQILIHFSIGMSVYFPVAFGFGWVPTDSAAVIVSFITLTILIFFLIWSGFYFYNRLEAKRINAKLEALETEQNRTEDMRQ